jgi:hypothetical protein
MLITVLLPSLNEEKGIKETINSIPMHYIKMIGYDLEILVVDGGSKDKTREVAQEHGAKILLTKTGYGRQYILGFRHSKGDIIVTADSDASYPLEKMCDYIKILIDEDLDFITTNRFADMRKGSMRKINKFGNIFLTFFTNLLFGLRLNDSQSGMWIIKRSVLDRIKLTSLGMALSEEIKIEAFRKLKSKEIPSTYYKREGRTKLSIIKHGLENFLFLFKKKIFMPE